IDTANMVELKNHVAVMAQSQFDQGPEDESRLLHVTMLFTPSPQQQQALQKLLADQQNADSPRFHQWLTSDQFGQQFGLSQNDIARVSSWLESEGLKVTYVAHGRDFLAFDGTVGQVQSVFHTTIHNFSVKGKMHFANVTPPMIPTALIGIVGGFRGLHNFTPHPMLKQRPNYTYQDRGTQEVLAPGDIATIYDINPLYQQTPAIDGTGQNVVIAGQSDVYIADINYFRSAFGFTSLSGCTMDSTNTIIQAGTCNTGNFQMVVPGDGADPGVSAGDLGESDLDIEWMNSVARGATIIFVTSSANSGGVDDSAGWAIDQNPPLAPVISYSYGLCEAFVTAPSITAAETTYAKAASEGISFFAASGDGASATCDYDGGAYPAMLGPSVSYPASSPNVTGVGGTEFDEGTGTFWSGSNGTNGGSAFSYIPESAWNDSALSFVNNLDGSGGGASNCAFGTGVTQVSGFDFEICAAPPNGGFPKPSWQNGVTSNDKVRDVPDIAFSASNVNDPYIVCVPQSETNGSSSTSTCIPATGNIGDINNALVTYNSAFGGTSASTPVTAGMTVLLNQYLGANGLGTINSQLYTLFTANPPGVFNEIENGTNSTTLGASNNIVACVKNDPSFEPLALQCSTGSFGFSVGGGHAYNQVTGLGSVDMNKLFTAWTASRSTTTTTLSASASNINQGASVTFTAAVSPSTATGPVSFFNNSSSAAIGSGFISNGTATFVTSSLPAGTNSVTATYNGSAANASSGPSAPAIVNVTGFTLSSTSSSVIAGHQVNVTVMLTPMNGFNSQVAVSCGSSVPAGITNCSFSPSTIPANPNQTTTTLTIGTAPSMAGGTTPVNVSIPITATGGGVTTNSTVSLTVNPTDQSFTLSLQGGNNQTIQVAQGATVQVTVNLTGNNGFNANVSYSCSDLASESACTYNTGQVSSSTPESFTISATAPVTQLRKPFGRGSGIFYAALLPGLLGIIFTVGSRKRSSTLRSMRILGLIVVLGVSTLWMGACSGSTNSTNKNPGTPTGTYTITITATTGGAVPVTNNSAPLTFTLTVVQ
ncbi:MAG: protease pro-enzyme activation domain-containing protein, partial [Candidatus Sulfotelmatobacter sp.]